MKVSGPMASEINDFIKSSYEKEVKKYKKEMQHMVFVSSIDGNQMVKDASIIGKKFDSISSNNETSKIYNGNSNS